MAWEICDGGRLAAMLLNEVTSKKPTKQKKNTSHWDREAERQKSRSLSATEPL